MPPGALLATEGKRVLVTDRSPVLGGRAMAVPDEGFKVNVGGHLIEDPGSGLTKVREYAAAGLRHLVMWNITAFGDPDPARYSFAALKELRAELAR